MVHHWHLLLLPADADADADAVPFLFPTLPMLSYSFPLTSLIHDSKLLPLLLPSLSASRDVLALFSKLPLACFSDSPLLQFNFPPTLSFTSSTSICNPIPILGASFSHSHSFVSFFRHSISTFSIFPLFTDSLPLLSLAAATIILPLHTLASNMFSIPPANAHEQMLGVVQTPSTAQHRACLTHSFTDHYWTRRAVEPLTGIEFPRVLNGIFAKGNQSNLSPEVLVGTGSRTVTIIKIKSLKVYAFGFYVHPHSICQKLGLKYATIPAAELKDRSDFYSDLLREDIGMTVRLVVNCNGMKISAVKDAFEKSLRARLVKTNPETDFKCIETFGSFFTKDIPLPVGTIIDLRRTSDGQLITEIGGNQIGAVHSRELCRAFFDMYLGEVPVSKQTKEEIGSNVAIIVGKC